MDHGITNRPTVYNAPKLERGLSKVVANQDIINETHSQIEHNYKNLNELNEINYLNKFLNNELTCYSFMMPNLNRIEDYRFKEYLQNDLFELPAQYNLTESGHLNWWTQNNWENICRPLYPMITSGDGNCLLHAASLAMWGLHDRYLILRKALNSTLTQIKEDNSSPMWRRWKWEQMCQNKKYGLIYDENEWAREWNSLLKLSSYQPRIASNNKNMSPSSKQHDNYVNTESNSRRSSSSLSSSSLKYNNSPSSPNSPNPDDVVCYFESLEEFHVFLLANILQRPIIIVSETMLHDLNGEPLSPIPFGGIYLPFECDLEKCHRYPLVLAYDSAHFSALVLMDEDDDDLDSDQQENYSDYDSVNFLSNEEINIINKKLQLKPPYSMIPIQYSNNEILPVHFAYDPGEDYDWSNFPRIDSNNKHEQSNKKKSPNSSNSSSNDNMSVSSINNNKHSEVNILSQTASCSSENLGELKRDQKMFLIQKYMDICKLELFDPGPLSKRNQLYNSNGMRASINNIHVPEPLFAENIEKFKEAKSSNKLQKFFSSLFKRKSSDKDKSSENNEKNMPFSAKFRQSVRNNNNSQYQESSKHETKSTLKSTSTNNKISTQKNSSKTLVTSPKLKSAQSSPTKTYESNSTIFHKVQTYKNWKSLFATINNSNNFLGIKLNLVKPPRFRQVISNYLDSTRKRFDMITQQHKAKILQQQHQLYLSQHQKQLLERQKLQQIQQEQRQAYINHHRFEQQQQQKSIHNNDHLQDRSHNQQNNNYSISSTNGHRKIINNQYNPHNQQNQFCLYSHMGCNPNTPCQRCSNKAKSELQNNNYTNRTNTNYKSDYDKRVSLKNKQSYEIDTFHNL